MAATRLKALAAEGVRVETPSGLTPPLDRLLAGVPQEAADAAGVSGACVMRTPVAS